jgi:high affinity sulfate transporter 1
VTAAVTPPRRSTGLAHLVPALAWLPRTTRSSLGKDVVGGLAAGSVVIPQAMAYATIADLPAQVGLYTCLVPMVVYALLGGSRTLSVSTTSTVAVLTGSTLIAAGVAASGEDPAGDLAMLTLLVGVILLAARLLKLGTLIDNISEATLTGIKVGVGLTVAAGQLPKLLGIAGDPTADAFIGEVRGIIEDLGDISWVTVALSVATIAVLLGVDRLAPRVPGPLLAVVLGIVLVGVFSIDQHGVALIAPVPSGLPTPVAPAFDHLGGLVGGGFAIAIMCFLETASVAGSVRRPDEPPIDNDQELAANGVSCVAGAFFRAMPSAGGFSQTAINQRSGAVTQLSELVTALLAVACALFLGGVLSDLPQATLGCMVVVAVAGLIRPAELRRFWHLDRVEFWVAVVTATSGLLFGLLPAVLIGVLLTLLLVLRELDRVGVTELQPTPTGDDVRAAGEGTVPVAGLLVLRLDGPLYTANVRGAHRRMLAAVDAAGPEVLVLDATAVGMLPVTVIDQFADLERELAARDVTFWIAALPPRTLATARRTPRWDELVGDRRLYPTSLAAIRHYRDVVEASGDPRTT